MATQVQPEVASGSAVTASTRWGDFRRAFAGNRLALVALAVMVAFVLLGVLAPLIAPYGPNEQALSEKFTGPSVQHWFGQDELGRDILSRVIYGARISLTAGLAAVAFATLVGAVVGLWAGYARGWVDSVLMRVMDTLLAFPSILLAIVVVTILGPSLVNAMLAVGIVNVPLISRVTRSAVLTVRERDYVEAVRAAGASHRQTLWTTILPNSLAPLIVQSTLTLATAVLDIAALSFLGLGAQPPMPEWGAMLTDAFRSGFGVFVSGQHALIFPGIAIAVSVLAVNLIGDGLRDAFDPRHRR